MSSTALLSRPRTPKTPQKSQRPQVSPGPTQTLEAGDSAESAVSIRPGVDPVALAIATGITNETHRLIYLACLHDAAAATALALRRASLLTDELLTGNTDAAYATASTAASQGGQLTLAFENAEASGATSTVQPDTGGYEHVNAALTRLGLPVTTCAEYDPRRKLTTLAATGPSDTPGPTGSSDPAVSDEADMTHPRRAARRSDGHRGARTTYPNNVTISVRYGPDAVADVQTYPIDKFRSEYLEGSRPWRSFYSHKGQKHLPGVYVATTNRMTTPGSHLSAVDNPQHAGNVGHESQLELVRLREADRDPDVTHIFSQPYRLRFRDEFGWMSYTPDYAFLQMRGGILTSECKPADQLTDPDIAHRLHRGHRVLRQFGMPTEIFTDRDMPQGAVLAVKLISTARHLAVTQTALLDSAVALCMDVEPWFAVEARMEVLADAPFTRPLIAALIWRGDLVVDFLQPLGGQTIVRRATPERTDIYGRSLSRMCGATSLARAVIDGTWTPRTDNTPVDTSVSATVSERGDYGTHRRPHRTPFRDGPDVRLGGSRP